MAEDKKTLILIDGHALAFRMFFALERTNMQTTDHIPTWAVWGFFKLSFYIKWALFGGYYMKKVAVVMGSDSDLKVVEKAILTLKDYGVETDVHIYSAHRTPVEAREFTLKARDNGIGVIIACAGKAAHLAGAIAANTTLPVIGVPIKASVLDGMDALLSTVQMPAGIPVATVAIDGAENAALLAIQILAVEDKELAKKLQDARDQKMQKILAVDKEVNQKYN